MVGVLLRAIGLVSVAVAPGACRSGAAPPPIRWRFLRQEAKLPGKLVLSGRQTNLSRRLTRWPSRGSVETPLLAASVRRTSTVRATNRENLGNVRE